MQVFEVFMNGQALFVDEGQTIEDFLKDKSEIKEEKVFLIIDDKQKAIWLYNGQKAGIGLQFVAIETQKAMRMQLRGFYSIENLNKLPKKSDLYERIIHSTIKKSGRAEEIRIEEEILDEEQLTKKQQEIKRQIEESRARETCLHKGVVPKTVIPNALKLDNPEGFHRNMTLIGASIYTEEEIVEKFLTEKKSRVDLKKVGDLPNGFFFLEGMSSRISIERGKVQFLDFMIEDKKVLGPNKLLVPILHKKRFNNEGNIDTLLNSFQQPEEQETVSQENVQESN